MFATNADPLGLNTLATLAANGFDYVEIPLAQTMELDDTEFAAAIKYLQSIGIPCEACNNFFPAHIKLTGSNVCETTIEQYMDKAIHRANKLGAKVIVFGSSGARNVAPGFDVTDALCQLVGALKMASVKATPHGINIAIESLNKTESNIINSLTEGAHLAKLVNCPNVGLLVDFYHMETENEPVDVIKTLADDGAIFMHAHIADALTGRGLPLDKSRLAPFANALKSINYNGKLSVEGYSTNPAAEIKLARETLAALFQGVPPIC